MVAASAAAREAKGPDSDATSGFVLAQAFNWQSGGDARGLKPNERTSALSVEQTPAVYQCHGSNVGEMGHLRSGNGHVTGGVPFVVGDPRRHDERHRGWEKPQTVHPTLGDTNPQTIAAHTIPRRLTPTECERLQGFPDDWTRYADDGREIADSPRYRMLGNAVTETVAEWIGHRLAAPSQPRGSES